MRKPEGYDEVAAAGFGGPALPPGGYICRILRAYEDTSRNGNRMLIIEFDIDEGKYENYFKKRYVASQPEGKWQGVYRQMVDGNSMKFFKGTMTAIEESNEGYVWNWDEKSLSGKLFGGVFRREEYRASNGEIRTSTKLMQIRSTQAIENGVDIPEDKRLASGNNDGYDGMTEDDCPF